MSAPQVLHVVESWPPVVSGYATRSWRIVTTQHRLGVSAPRVLVTSRQRVYGVDTVVEPDAVPVIRVAESPRERRLRSVRKFYLDRRALAAAITQAAEDADLIHVHWSSGIGSAAADAAAALRVPLVAEVRFDLAGATAIETFRGVAPFLEAPLRRHFERHLSAAAQIVAASDSLGELLTRSFPQSRAKLTIVPNGVDPPAAPGDREGIRKQLGVEGKCVIGTTSKMLRYENLEAIIEAAAKIDDCVAVFVGTGPQRSALEQLATRRNAPVKFVNPVPASEVKNHLAALDIFAVPRRAATITRYASPIKIVEAMAAGTPVVATAVGDVPQLLGAERGVVVPAQDQRAFVSAVESLVNDPVRRAAIAQRAAAWIYENLRWDQLIPRYCDVYRKALA